MTTTAMVTTDGDRRRERRRREYLLALVPVNRRVIAMSMLEDVKDTNEYDYQIRTLWRADTHKLRATQHSPLYAVPSVR